MAKIVVDCPFNKGVGCEETPGPVVCKNCGWNPEVERVRKEQIQVAIQNVKQECETPERWMLGSGPMPE